MSARTLEEIIEVVQGQIELAKAIDVPKVGVDVDELEKLVEAAWKYNELNK